jgi:hypothetical protein
MLICRPDTLFEEFAALPEERAAENTVFKE